MTSTVKYYGYFDEFTVTAHDLIYNVKCANGRIPSESATSGQSKMEKQRLNLKYAVQKKNSKLKDISLVKLLRMVIALLEIPVSGTQGEPV